MLNPNQLKALDLLVNEGMMKKEVAATLGIVPETISHWFQNQEFSSEYEIMLRNTHKELAKKATDRLAKLIDDEQSSTALGAVKLTLSIAGYDAVVKQEITQKNIVIGVEQDGTEDNSEEGDIQLDISASSDRL